MEINKQNTHTHTCTHHYCVIVCCSICSQTQYYQNVFSSLLFWSDIFCCFSIESVQSVCGERENDVIFVNINIQNTQPTDIYTQWNNNSSSNNRGKKRIRIHSTGSLLLCVSVVCSLFLHIHCAVLYSKVHKINVCSGKTDLINYMIALFFSALHSTSRVTSIHLQGKVYRTYV